MGMLSLAHYSLKGKYRNGKYVPEGWTAACPLSGGKDNGISTNPDDREYLFL